MIISRNRYGSTLHPRCVGRSHRCLGAESMQRMLLLLRKIVLYTPYVLIQYTCTQHTGECSTQLLTSSTWCILPAARCSQDRGALHYCGQQVVHCTGAGQSKGGDGTLGGDNEEAGFNIIPPSSNQPTNPTTQQQPTPFHLFPAPQPLGCSLDKAKSCQLYFEQIKVCVPTFSSNCLFWIVLFGN